MGVFTRFRDIIYANINSMLEKAEDPEKLIRLMIREMEDTLIEIKANCAGAMAQKAKIQRESEEIKKLREKWSKRAELAVEKGRYDLARDAIYEKRRHKERVEALERETAEMEAVVKRFQDDIVQLEDKLNNAREKQRVLVQRLTQAQIRKRAQEDIRHYDTADAIANFEQFENRIERLEAESDLVNYGRKKPTLDDEFSRLEGDEDIEQELQELKARKEQQK